MTKTHASNRGGHMRHAVSRRGIIAGTVAAAAALVAKPRLGDAEGASGDALTIPPWETQPGSPVLAAPYGAPSPFEKTVIRRPRAHVEVKTDLSSISLTPLQNLDGIITPSGLHYERHHAGVPAIDPEAYRLVVHGLVKRPLIFTMDDLACFPSESRLHFLECSGNTQNWTAGKPDWTVQDTHGLLSCSEWTGVKLSTILDEVGIDRSAKWILAEGADAASMTRSVPIAKALDDALLVYAQNGERLRPEQGYPVRLLLPGFEGNVSVKWLRRLKIGAAPFETREETSKYTGLLPNGKARQFAFIMEAKSVITRPSGGLKLSKPGFHEITGLAWSGRGKIVRVDVSVDGGKSWHAARLQAPVLDKCLTRFRFPWHWDGGPATLQSRAIDSTGYVQPTHDQLVAARGLQSYYHYNGIQSWSVAAGGAVSYAA